MIFANPDEAVKAIKDNLKINPLFTKMREYSTELKALVDGEMFLEELIEKIEGIESQQKAKAREKYSRCIKDMFERLFQPIDNIYFANGGVKSYDIPKESIKKEYLTQIANIRDGKTLSEWVQQNAIHLFHTDPNGVVFLEYKTEPKLKVYPTYKSINSIRYYKPKGQLLEYIIFEPKLIDNIYYWRVVDDKYDYTFKQEGNTFVLVEEKTFEHQFGKVPAVICSNIQKPAKKYKLSSIDTIIDVAKEYARDTSFVSLYKVYKANPYFWRYVQYCGDCSGTGKQGDESCPSCNGMGKIVAKSDVTDVIDLPAPTSTDDPVIAPNIAGFISPDLDVWEKFEETLKMSEENIYKTHWGTNYGMQSVQGMKTATEVTFDKQPLENKLNKYADYAEYVEWVLSEMILNVFDVTKDKEESLITINLGRRYIVDNYDSILELYEKAVEKGDNSVILDKIFFEYLSSKYRNNPIDLQINLLKANVEPYLHLSHTVVKEVFGNEEAQRKLLFPKWWSTVVNYNKTTEQLTNEYNTWFETNKKEIETDKNNNLN